MGVAFAALLSVIVLSREQRPARPHRDRATGDRGPQRPKSRPVQSASDRAAAQVLRIRVVDDAGNPARGITVGILVTANSGRRCRVAEGRTDSSGSVAFDAKLRARLRSAGVLDAVQATCDLAGLDPSGIPVPASAWDGGTVLLRLPAVGRLIVRLLAERARGTAYLAWMPPGPKRRVLKAAFADGAAVFDKVGLGLDLRVTVSLDDPRLHAREARAAGPRRAGEEVLIEMPVTRRSVIPVRIVDSLGRPVATGWEYRIITVPAAVLVARALVRADANGMIRVPLPTRSGREVLELHVRELDPRECGLDVSRVGSAGFPAGEIVVRDDFRRAGILTGTVVDGNGRPVVAATVVVRAVRGKRLATRSTDRKGEFRVADLPVGLHVGIEAGRPGYCGAEVSDQAVTATTASVRLQLARAGGLKGRILLDENLPLEGIEIVLVHLGAAHAARTTGCLPGGRWGFVSLRPGKVRVLARIAGADWQVFRSGVRTVTAARVRTVDPIDLRGRLRRIEVRILQEDGSPLASTRMRLTDDAGALACGFGTDTQGRLRALAPIDRTRLRLDAKGFARALWQPGTRTVTLHPLR